jgi:hypothetical protein
VKNKSSKRINLSSQHLTGVGHLSQLEKKRKEEELEEQRRKKIELTKRKGSKKQRMEKQLFRNREKK